MFSLIFIGDGGGRGGGGSGSIGGSGGSSGGRRGGGGSGGSEKIQSPPNYLSLQALDAPVANAAFVCSSSRAHPPPFPCTLQPSPSPPLYSPPRPSSPTSPSFTPVASPSLLRQCTRCTKQLPLPPVASTPAPSQSLAYSPSPPPIFCSHFRRLTLPLRTPPASAPALVPIPRLSRAHCSPLLLLLSTQAQQHSIAQHYYSRCPLARRIH